MPKLSAGKLVLSIDLELNTDALDLIQEQSLEALHIRLMEVMASFDVAATWAVSDPAVSAATDRILAAAQPHEIAVLGDSTWVGHSAGRGRFARELSRRVLGARSAGLPITTLALRNVALDDHSDLVVKNGLTVVREGIASADGRAQAKEQSGLPALHYGLWSLPPTLLLPQASGWLPGSWRLRRRLEGCIARSELLHVVVDAPHMLRVGSSSERQLASLLEHASLRRRQGRLQIETLAQAASQLVGGRRVSSARSILKSAA